MKKVLNRVKRLCWLLAMCLFNVVSAQKKPNILFIMSDDHTSQAIGAYGGMLAALNPTPTIDKIAKEGMLMTNASCQNAICTPSRASIITGQSSAVNGCPILDNPLPKEKQYLALEMSKAGYQTAVVGKWHLVDKPEAFDYYKVLIRQGKYFNPVFIETGATGVSKIKRKGEVINVKGTVKMEGHSSDCIADSALDYLKNKRTKDKPFFLKLHFKAPHGPFESAPRYQNYLKDVTIPEPKNMRKRNGNGSIATRGDCGELAPYIGTSIGRRNKRRNYTKTDKKFPWVYDLDQTKNDQDILGDAYQGYIKAYLRCVKGVDDNLKRVIDYLKKEDLYDNTVIMYTGDQGFFLGEHDYMDKRWPYEESMRMPFIVRYPKKVKVGISDAVVENIDYAPTILDFAGVNTPNYMHGKSFKNILETGKETKQAKKYAYYHYWMHMASHDNPACIAIKSKDYKLILFYGTTMNSDKPETPPAWEFYNLKEDPTEDYNVYGVKKYAKIIKVLKDELKKKRKVLGEDNSKFKFNKVIDEYWEYDRKSEQKAIQISHEYLKKMLSK